MAARKRASKRKAKRKGPPQKRQARQHLDSQELAKLGPNQLVDDFFSRVLTELPADLVRPVIVKGAQLTDPVGVALFRDFIQSLYDRGETEEREPRKRANPGKRAKAGKRSKTAKRSKR